MPAHRPPHRLRHDRWAIAVLVALLSAAIAVVRDLDLTVPASLAAPAPDAFAPVRFPIRIAPDGRRFVDAEGKPFLLHGEAAWSLIAQLTREKVDRYLADRRARGVNALVVNLLERRYATHAPANAYGDAPFRSAGDYGAPNEAYFAHADWVLKRAGDMGFLVLLTPSYMGAGGGEEGWYREMIRNGAERLRRYGEFLGRRYRGATNVLWLHGGDYDPPDRALADAIAEGIRAAGGGGLHGAHGAPETPVGAVWGEAGWLQVDTVYTYRPVFEAARRSYRQHDGRPFILLEAAYENEHGATSHRLRVQAYQALLSGAAGHVFGNNPIWHFDGPGLFAAPMTWEAALDGAGSRSMTQVRRLFDDLPWWRLEPDLDGRFLIDGGGARDDRTVAAIATDGSVAVVYMPTGRRITIDRARLAGPGFRARWHDPVDGTVADAEVGPTGVIRPPRGRNRGGAGDWVLVIEAGA